MKRILSWIFFVIILNIPLFASAGKVTVLLSRTAGPYSEALQGIQQAGKFEIDVLNMEGDIEKGNQLVKGLTTATTSALITVGTEAGSVADSLAPEIPLVYTMVLDPIDVLKHKNSGVIIKLSVNDQLSRLRKMFPQRKRLGVIYNPAFSKREIEEARSLTGRYEFTFSPIAVEKQEEVASALSKFSPETTDLIWMVFDKTVSSPVSVDLHIRHSLKTNIPVVGLSVFHVKAGMMLAFSADFNDVGIQTSKMVQRSMAGENGKVEPPKKIQVFLNSKIQKQLSINDLVMIPEIQVIQ